MGICQSSHSKAPVDSPKVLYGEKIMGKKCSSLMDLTQLSLSFDNGTVYLSSTAVTQIPNLFSPPPLPLKLSHSPSTGLFPMQSRAFCFVKDFLLIKRDSLLEEKKKRDSAQICIFYFTYKECFACMHPFARRCWDAWDPLALELLMTASHYVGARNWTSVLCKNRCS